MSRTRVLIVDDSVVIRSLLSERLGAFPDIEVVGAAANGRLALSRLAITAVDVMILDVEMPELDGLATLRELRKLPKRPRVIMFSSLTTENAKSTVDALALGAEECVAKPSNIGGSTNDHSEAIETLVQRIRGMSKGKTAISFTGGPLGHAEVLPSRPRTNARIDIVAIGASTGGPNALCQLFSRIPARFPVPIVIVQHMPATFTKHFAERMTRETNIAVDEGEDGVLLVPGRAWIAPGGRHMIIKRDGPRLRLALHDGPPVCSCRPAVDVLFESVAGTFLRSALAVVLTGMGDDGKMGSKAICDAGGSVIVQDAASSVVWGMAGSVAKAGIAEAILPLDDLGDEIVRRARIGRS